MKLKINLLAIFLLSSFLVHGNPTVDTIPIPDKLMDLPNVVQNHGDRAGSWGLPTLIALRYGLTVCDTLDERLDEEAATRAATAYLRDLYAEFGNWDLCYFAYLYSPAYLRNILARCQDTIVNNFDINRYHKSLRTRPFIPPTLQKTTVKKNNTPKARTKPNEPKYVTYVVKKGDTLSKIAKKYRVSVKDIMKWNNMKNDIIREKQKLKIRQ